MLRAMNAQPRFTRWVPALGAALLLGAGAAPAAVTMEGEVTLGYYVADVDAEGFEYPATDFYVEQIANDDSRWTGPLSLAGWATSDASPAGDGSEIGYVPLDPLAPHSSVLDVAATADADDVAPGEYYVHVLLQDDDFPGTFEDARGVSPRLLWRGGLEAVGPLTVTTDSAGRLYVDFDALRNNRLDSRITNPIELTLYATYGFGPASDGHVLCRTRVPGLYAGDRRFAPGFDCWPNAVPDDGDYTLHLEVAEEGGRGGYSTLSGPDMYFRGGYADDGYVDGEVYVSGAAAGWLLLPLAAGALWRRRRIG